MLILSVNYGDRIVCRDQRTGEMVEVHILKKRSGHLQIGFRGPRSIRFMLEKQPKPEAGPMPEPSAN